MNSPESNAIVFLVLLIVFLKSFTCAAIDSEEDIKSGSYENEAKLYEAVEKGDFESVIGTHKHGYTPLHLAAIKGYDEILKILTAHSIDLEIRDNAGRTALQEAVIFGQIDSVQILIDAHANVNVTDYNKQSLLHLASPSGNSKLFKILIKYCNLEGRDSLNKTALFRAVERGNMAAFRFLLDNGADPLTQGHLGNNLIHIAAENGHISVVKELSKFKELLNSKNQLEDTPLFTALDNNQTEIVYELINQGAMIDKEYIWKALVEEDYDIVKFMVNQTGDFNVRHPRITKDCGNTLLMDAVSLARLKPKESLSLVQFLLNNGADVSLINCDGSTALHFATSNHLNKTMFQLLIDKGASLNAKDFEGFSPLDLACGKTVEFLRKIGAKFGDEI